MKLLTSVLILGLTGTALAQAPASKTAAPPAAKTQAAPANAATKPAQASASKPSQGTPAKPAQGATTKPVPSQTANSKPAVTSAKAQEQKKAPVKAAPAAKSPEAKAAEGAEEKKQDTATAKNRRDPFVSIVMSREGPPCAGGGKKCLAIDQVTLQGVVRSPNGPIAVVSSGSNKTYFLRENDPVYNGVVVKISPDSILFRETVMDRLGKTSQRDVVKKIRPSV